jgi:molecular chaperone DnaK (HSP70)
VPTVVVYDKQTSQVSSWGFMSETRTEQNNNSNREYCDWFKTFLDPAVLKQAQTKDPENSPKSQASVDKWTEDYMRLLYQHVEFKLSGELPANKPWNLAKVEFLFSVPTTWAPNPTVEKFKNIASRAGFGVQPNHVLNVGLTEAEAAAVHVSVEAPGIFEENQVLLVCDAGGGTTDLSVMRVSGIQRGVPSLKQLDVVNGRNIGSAQIDQAFEDLVLSRLEEANKLAPLGVDIEDAAWIMMKSAQYQDAKCCYGAPDDINFNVNVPGLDLAYTNPHFAIQNGQMMFTLADLQALFDAQINRLFDLIDSQLQSFQQKFPTDSIAHLVLSGGLGNSAYVQRRLKERYAMSSSNTLQVHVSPDPQLAVCKGMVADRVAQSKGGKAILTWRCCRASYGTICKCYRRNCLPNHSLTR